MARGYNNEKATRAKRNQHIRATGIKTKGKDRKGKERIGKNGQQGVGIVGGGFCGCSLFADVSLHSTNKCMALSRKMTVPWTCNKTYRNGQLAGVLAVTCRYLLGKGRVMKWMVNVGSCIAYCLIETWFCVINDDTLWLPIVTTHWTQCVQCVFPVAVSGVCTRPPLPPGYNLLPD